MPSANSLLALATAVSTVSATAFQGFNYASSLADGTAKTQSDYETEFKVAAGLDGTDGAFTSARLYTMIQGSSGSEPIEAIPAAIKTKTSLLFGLWASAGSEQFNNEIAALKGTIDQYCDQLDGLVAGISVGSEDLYRITPTAIKNHENPGAEPDVLVNYIKLVRDTIKGSCLSDVPVGHVDTWNAYVNESSTVVIEACDFLGMDTYPYYEDTKPNGIEHGAQLFKDAYEKIANVAGSREIWVTETGWPTSGKASNQAVASLKNARTYWENVGCPLFGKTNTWWYTLQDGGNPVFSVVGSQLTTKPLYDLSCKGVSTELSLDSSSSSSKSSGTSSGSGSSSKEKSSSSKDKSSSSSSSAGSNMSSSGTGSSSSDKSSSGSSSGEKSTPTPGPCMGNCAVGNGTATIFSPGFQTKAAVSPEGGSSSSSGSGSGSASGSGAGAGSGTSSGAASGSGSGSGSSAGAEGTPSTLPASSGTRVQSIGAAAVALLLAIVVY